MIPKQHRNKAAALGIAAVAISGFEGMRRNVYYDVVHVPTYCIGETKNPNWNHTYSTQECRDLLAGRLEEFDRGVMSCVKTDIRPKREAAYVSLAYNIGVGGFCKSSVVRLENAGKPTEACDAMLRFNRAGGLAFPGLTRRREQERTLCLAED